MSYKKNSETDYDKTNKEIDTVEINSESKSDKKTKIETVNKTNFRELKDKQGKTLYMWNDSNGTRHISKQKPKN